MNAPPIPCTWDGEVFRPIRHMQRICDRHFVVGEDYRLVVHEERSPSSHRHEFAFIKEAWLNLPEQMAALYPSPEHLRKRALIEAGFYDEQIVDAGSNAAAIRVAAAFRSREEFALVIVRGPLVAIRTAKSQSHRAMDRKTFQASKDGILRVLSEMLGVEPASLTKAEAA